MQKIIICMSLMCVIPMMQASEKTIITKFDELRSEVRRAREASAQNKNVPYLDHLITKSNRISSEQSRDTKTFTQKKENV